MTITTVQDVFDIAIRLMDAQNESTGSTNTSDTKEYKVRTCSLLNSLLDEVYPYSDTYERSIPGKRGICPKVENMEDLLDLDEAVCSSVLPYGLASLLLTEENPTLSNFFWQIYEQNLNTLASRGLPSEFEPIDDNYSQAIEYGYFSQW